MKKRRKITKPKYGLIKFRPTMLRAGNFKHIAACDALNPYIGQKFIHRSRIDALIAGAGMPLAL